MTSLTQLHKNREQGIARLRKNDVIKAYYKDLKAKGKPSNIALVASMRKRLLHLNSLLAKFEKPTPNNQIL